MIFVKIPGFNLTFLGAQTSYLTCTNVCVCLCVCADRVLEAEEHQLYLVDGGGVEVQVQLELGDGSRHDAPLRGMDEVSKDTNDLLDVIDGELELLTALHI